MKIINWYSRSPHDLQKRQMKMDFPVKTWNFKAVDFQFIEGNFQP